jgi:septum formation protein
MLRVLSGRAHSVLTGVCLLHGGQVWNEVATTRVWFNRLSDEEIASYCATPEPLDKAGAYAIQGLASRYISRIDGCYFNVVGLPVPLVYRMLKKRGAIG